MLKRACLSFMVLIALWQLSIFIWHIPSFILPTPVSVARCIMTQAPFLLQQMWPTAWEALSGLILATAIGCTAAIVLALFPVARLWLLPALIVSQALPTFAIAPILVLWLGYGMASKILTVMIMLFFPITSAFYDGLTRVDTAWLDLAQTMRAKPWAVLRYIAIPAALPALATGLRLAAAGAPLGAVVGEWVGSSQGLGFLMLNANARLQVDMMFAALFCLILLALALYFIVDKSMKRLVQY